MRYPFLSYLLFTTITWLITLGLKRYLPERVLNAVWINKLLTFYIPTIFSLHFLFLYYTVKYHASITIYLLFQYSLYTYATLYTTILFWLLIKMFTKRRHNKKKSYSNEMNFERRKFIINAATLTASIPFISLSYGMLQGRFSFRVNNISIPSPNLPNKFNKFRIVQISDIHLGSFIGFESRLTEMVTVVNNQNPDLIIFTGDLINNFSEEIAPFISTLKQLQAKIGMVAILGNHDYGDYCEWETPELKELEQTKIKNAFKEIGFKLLLNESISITIEDEEIAICGVENWGKPPFPQYGDLNKAAQGIDNFAYKILLTHDPDHWEAEVLNKRPFNLTLSGHTHGFQMGFIWGNNQWSPAKLKFNYWGGLYHINNQFLYVNSGIGSLGIPARIGMPPEITTLILKKS